MSESELMLGLDTPQSEMSSLGIVQFGFHAKTSFDADDALLQSRSENFKTKPPPKDDDIWKRPPPDFRVVVYDPKPPKRNSRDAMEPWRYGTIPGQKMVFRREKTSLLPRIFKDHGHHQKEFLTRFRIPRPFTAKNMFVREGMYSAGHYEMPKLHDFRGYPPIKSLGLPEFETEYERDPYNLKFNTERLNTIHGLTFGAAERDLVEGRQMAPPMPSQLKYDPDLILEREPWPQRYAAFTRHRRRNRPPYSAFMERVETELVSQWAKEKMEKALQEQKQLKEAETS